MKAELSGGPPSLLDELDLGIARLKREETEVRTIVEQRTKLTGAAIRELVERGEPVDAAYAQAVGIVHQINMSGTGLRQRR